MSQQDEGSLFLKLLKEGAWIWME